MDRNEENDESSSGHTARSQFLPKQISKDGPLYWPKVEVVEHEEINIESIYIVGEQVHELPHSRLSLG